MPEAGVLQFLAKKPERDAAADADFSGRFYKNIGPAFRAVDADIEKGGHSEYLLKGGRGSLKSSFISMELVKLLREDTRANALVLRKVAATMRDTVFAQILWALDTLGVYDEWECTVSPMKGRCPCGNPEKYKARHLPPRGGTANTARAKWRSGRVVLYGGVEAPLCC